MTHQARWFRAAAAMALLLAVLPVAVAAQAATSAVIRGEVRDAGGLAVAGAAVTLLDSDGRALATTATDGAGRFILLNLTPGGPYTVTAEHAAFAGQATLPAVQLAAGESRRVTLVLRAAPVPLPAIRVLTGADQTFAGTRTGAATTIEARAIRTLPNIERDIIGLTALSSMAAIHDGAVTVAGQNARYNSVRIDGGLAQDVFGLSPTGVPGGQANARPLPMDAVRQYSVLIAPYDVRQSGFTGGLLDATTRSGGERWEGAAFAYYRDGGWAGTPADDGGLGIGGGVMEESRTESAGLWVGGPIGRARVLAVGEIERRRRPLPGLHVGRVDPIDIRLTRESVSRLVTTLLRDHDFDPGHADAHRLENPLGNVFARVDVPLSPRHDLAAHYNLISASDDVGALHLGFGPYQLSSAGTRLDSRTHAVHARLATRLGDRTSNHFLMSVQRTADRHRPLSDLPHVEVWVESPTADGFVRRQVQAGGEPIAHDNALDQTTVHLANSLSHAVGAHLFTVGAEGMWFGIERRHLPASRGIWRFDSLSALEQNRPSAYERLVLDERADPTIGLSVLQLSLFAQDEWAVSDALSVALGLRLDLPVPLNRPTYNRQAEVAAGVVTDRLATSGVMVSPRVGFNWSPETRRRVQLRGGVGLFAGVPPMAWIAESYANTGLRTGLLVCEGGAAPAFEPGSPPATCADGSADLRRDLTVFGDNFRYPQDLRASLAVDHELPLGLVGSVEGVFTRAMNQVAVEDMNLGTGSRGPFSPQEGFAEGMGDRPIFGTPRLIPDRFGPLDPQRRWDEFGSVLRVGNRSRNAALAVATEIQRRFSDRLDFRLAYTYTRSVDTRTLMFEDAALNYGLTPVRGDPARPEPRPSIFDQPHRVMGSVWARVAPWGEGLELSIFYIGQSGLPYSYVYETDMNGDGFPGPGAAAGAYNDLFYMPLSGSELPLGAVSNQMVMQLAALEPCLQEMEGSITARNECRAPWSNRLDLRVSQGLSLPVGRVHLTGDLMNMLNLLNGGWGLVHTVPHVVPIYRVDRRMGCPGLNCAMDNELAGLYTGPRRRDPVTGTAGADLPYVLSLPDSRWRAQLGLRLEF